MSIFPVFDFNPNILPQRTIPEKQEIVVPAGENKIETQLKLAQARVELNKSQMGRQHCTLLNLTGSRANKDGIWKFGGLTENGDITCTRGNNEEVVDPNIACRGMNGTVLLNEKNKFVGCSVPVYR